MARIKQTDVVMKVSITLPHGVNLKDGTEYVRDAVKGWKGGLDFQTDPLAKINPDTVRVSLMSHTVVYDH